MQDRVCVRTQTTAIDIAEQNTEVTVSPPTGGRLQREGGGFQRGGTKLPTHKKF